MRQVQAEGRVAMSRGRFHVEGVVSAGLADLRQELLLKQSNRYTARATPKNTSGERGPEI